MKTLLGLAMIALAGCGAGMDGSSSGTPQASAPPQTVAQAPAVNPLSTTKIAFMGDSITFYWDSPADTSQAQLLRAHLSDFIDAGIGGQTSVQMAARFQTDILDQHPDVIVIDAGTNDVDQDQSGNTSALFEMIIAAQASGAQVIVGTLPPNNWSQETELGHQLHAQWNDAIRTGAKSYGYQVAEYYDAMVLAAGSQDSSLFKSDHVHPNDAGYAVMWKVLEPLLRPEAL